MFADVMQRADADHELRGDSAGQWNRSRNCPIHGKRGQEHFDRDEHGRGTCRAIDVPSTGAKHQFESRKDRAWFQD